MNALANGTWFVRAVPRAHAHARLFCFPHAGGGASSYRPWGTQLPPELEVCAIQPPGRENRLREPAFQSMPRLVDALSASLRPWLDRPFAFFGHSMGAVVAAEVARALESSGGPVPAHLFVSARRPPHVPGTETPMHLLPDDAFVAELERRYGGIPREVRQERELMELLLPTLRADITALETYQPPLRAPLGCPITAFGGAEDPRTPWEHLAAWRDVTRETFRARAFPGGHFYVDAQRRELLADIAATLAPLTRSRGAQVIA